MNNQTAREIEQKINQEGIFILSTSSCSNMAEIVLDLVNFSNLNPTKEIYLYISSTVTDFVTMMTIYDVIKTLSNPISVIALGRLSNYATLLVAACKKGKRFCLPHAAFNISQPHGYLSIGTNLETDVTIAAKEAKLEREEYERLLALETGLDIQEVHRLAQEGTDLHPDEAIKLGILDKVL